MLIKRRKGTKKETAPLKVTFHISINVWIYVISAFWAAKQLKSIRVYVSEGQWCRFPLGVSFCEVVEFSSEQQTQKSPRLQQAGQTGAWVRCVQGLQAWRTIWRQLSRLLTTKPCSRMSHVMSRHAFCFFFLIHSGCLKKIKRCIGSKSSLRLYTKQPYRTAAPGNMFWLSRQQQRCRRGVTSRQKVTWPPGSHTEPWRTCWSWSEQWLQVNLLSVVESVPFR